MNPSDQSISSSSPQALQKPTSASPMQSPTLSEIGKEGQAEVLAMLTFCYQAMHRYGTPPEAIKATTQVFCSILAPFPMQKIREAFREHVETKAELPSPACIRKLIIPPRYMENERDHHIAAKRKRGEELSSIQLDYLRHFGMV